MLGTLIGRRYKVMAVLGKGGYGHTYVAEDTQRPGSPKCVVKLLKPAKQSPTFLKIARRLFKAEAESLQVLGQYDQIPQLLAYFEEKQEFYLVQELIEGHPLSEELRSKPRYTEEEVVSLLQDVLGILELVHKHQVIHRDIKPSNLIRRYQDKRLVLIDFGAVKQIETQRTIISDQTGATVAIGTEGYMPSEQMAGRPQFTSDIYALGKTAIQALTGLHPTRLLEDPKTCEVIWQNHAQVSEGLAAIISKMVRYNFKERYQSATEVLAALHSLQHLKPEGSPPTFWRRIGQLLIGTSLGVVTLTSLVATGLVHEVRQMGVLQGPELSAYDQMMRLRPDAGPDNRLLVVGITEQDIQTRKEYPLHDATVVELLKKLQAHQPRAIGIDIFRDVAQGSGRTLLTEYLKHSKNIIGVCKLSDTDNPGLPPPPGIADENVGTADLTVDSHEVVRRYPLISAPKDTKVSLPSRHLCNNPKNDQLLSLSFQLALLYLEPLGIKPEQFSSQELKIGSTIFKRLAKSASGYNQTGAEDYEILLNYRSATNAVKIVSLNQVLSGAVDENFIKNRVVLIGYTSPIARDYFYTPYSPGQPTNQQMAGVIIHAQAVSQILSVALDQQRLIWYWPQKFNLLWIAAWAVVSSSLAWLIRQPLKLTLSAIVTLGILLATCFGLFTQQGWVLVIAPILSSVLAGTFVVICRRIYRNPIVDSPISSSHPVGSAKVAEDSLFIKFVTFDPESDEIIECGHIEPNQRQHYLVSVSKGQLLIVEAVEGNINLIMVAPDGQTMGIVTGSTASWQGKVLLDGDYKIEVSAFEPSTYALSFYLLDLVEPEVEEDTENPRHVNGSDSTNTVPWEKRSFFPDNDYTTEIVVPNGSAHAESLNDFEDIQTTDHTENASKEKKP